MTQQELKIFIKIMVLSDVDVNFDIEYQDKKNKAFIYFRVFEGQKYSIRKIDYENLIDDFEQCSIV